MQPSMSSPPAECPSRILLACKVPSHLALIRRRSDTVLWTAAAGCGDNDDRADSHPDPARSIGAA